MVVYRPLYECKYSKEHNLDVWIRPLKMFTEKIDTEKYQGNRFIKIEGELKDKIRNLQ